MVARYMILIYFSGERQFKAVQPAGATESEVIKDLARKIRLTLQSDDLAPLEDAKDCIACKSVSR